MEKYIIKASGTMPEIIAALKTLQAISGRGATLADVARQHLKIVIDNQINNIKVGKNK